MWPAIRDFFVDKAVFLNTLSRWSVVIRAILGALALAVTSGQIDLGAAGWWSGPVLLAASFLVRGGDKAVPLTDQFAALTPEQRTAILAHIQSAP